MTRSEQPKRTKFTGLIALMARVEARQLLHWSGPFGGLPPLDIATPALIAEAVGVAIEEGRQAIAAITANNELPTFRNTIEALEESGAPLVRIKALQGHFASTMATGDMPEVAVDAAARLTDFENEVANNRLLMERIEAVRKDSARLKAEEGRLLEMVHRRFTRLGAGLEAYDRARLAEVNRQLSTLQVRFAQNLASEADSEFIIVDDAQALDGLTAATVDACRRAAQARDMAGKYVVPNVRSMVWPVLLSCKDRALRERVHKMWTARGSRTGARDNRPIVADIVRLRDEKARLLGYPSFAHLATSDRMAKTPEAALDIMQRSWARVLEITRIQLDELEGIMQADGVPGSLMPWDRYYYAEKARNRRFNLKADELKPYLRLDNVIAMIFGTMGKLHGFTFHPLPEAPVNHPGVRAYEVRFQDDVLGLLWLDLLGREGKTRGSWQSELRPAQTFGGRQLSCSVVVSSVDAESAGYAATLAWEQANVLFHEFGHALHMLASRAHYAALGSMGVAWDMIELPALLNERWLQDRSMMQRHLRHAETGEVIPDHMVDAIEAGADFDRVFSLQCDYLAPAIVDMKIHLAAGGDAVDPTELERATWTTLEMPAAVDPIMSLPNLQHCFGSETYAAGLYSYLWADMMAAEVFDLFKGAPGGIYDPALSRRWRDELLGIGNTVPADEAYRQFAGKAPSLTALFVRFSLEPAE